MDLNPTDVLVAIIGGLLLIVLLLLCWVSVLLAKLGALERDLRKSQRWWEARERARK